jgi:hypothetical protein
MRLLRDIRKLRISGDALARRWSMLVSMMGIFWWLIGQLL